MARERWVAGNYTVLAWADAFTSSVMDGILNGNAILSNLTISNDLIGDLFADLSIHLSVGQLFALPAYVGVYVYPSNTYNNTFGDGRFVAQAAGPPPSCYWVGDINIIPANQNNDGTLCRIPIPPNQFRFVLYNQGGATWNNAGSQNLCQYRTYNLQLA